MSSIFNSVSGPIILTKFPMQQTLISGGWTICCYGSSHSMQPFVCGILIWLSPTGSGDFIKIIFCGEPTLSGNSAASSICMCALLFWNAGSLSWSRRKISRASFSSFRCWSSIFQWTFLIQFQNVVMVNDIVFYRMCPPPSGTTRTLVSL